MLYVEMDGRCGNQLFHYAVARYIQLTIGNKEKLCLNFNKIFEKKDENNGWIDYLKDFKTVPYSYYSKSGTILKNESNFIQKIAIGLKAIQIKSLTKKSRQEQADKAEVGQRTLNKLGVYWVREGVNQIYPYKNNKILVSGICESNFIYEIQEQLQKELIPVAPVSSLNKSLLEKIDNCNSVCISVRRGDFFNNKNAKKYGVCSPEYYIRAKKYFDKKRLENTVYFCFSDDIDWCKENLKFTDKNVIFVSQEMPVYETLRLMSHCKHFILSNSTFSWWGQFLSEYKEKIVVSPARWNNDGYDTNLIDKNWILIDA